MTGRRAVVTGVGTITPFGTSTRALWHGVCAGRSAARRLTPDEAAEYGLRVGAPVTGFEPTDFVDLKAARLMTKSVAFGAAAAVLAAADSAVDFTSVACDRLGVFVGTSGRTYDPAAFERAVRHSCTDAGLSLARFGAQGLVKVDPVGLLKGLGNGVLYEISRRFRAVGPNATFPDGDVSAALAIGEAARAIGDGALDVAFAGAYDSLLERDRSRMLRAAGLVVDDAADGECAGGVFGESARGSVAAEGAAFLILEDSARATARGARLYGEVAGFGRVTAPATADRLGASATGFTTALRAALSDAGVEHVDAIFACGPATRASDRAEASAVRAVTANWGETAAVSALKRCIGHCGAASAAVESVVALLALGRSGVPAAVDLSGRSVSPRAPGDGQRPRRAQPIDALALNSVNRAGAHASIVLRQCRAAEPVE